MTKSEVKAKGKELSADTKLAIRNGKRFTESVALVSAGAIAMYTSLNCNHVEALKYLGVFAGALTFICGLHAFGRFLAQK